LSKSNDFIKTHQKPELLEGENQTRFGKLLEHKFHTEIVDDKGSTVVIHYKIQDDNGNKMNVILYSTGSLVCSSSPKIGERSYTEMEKIVLTIIGQCVNPLSKSRPATAIRSKSIIVFVDDLDISIENNRMIAVILSDTINEISLTEMMRKEKIKGTALEEGLAKKIAYLEKKGLVIPYKADLESVRNLRNDVVHKGIIPDENQTNRAIEITNDFSKVI